MKPVKCYYCSVLIDREKNEYEKLNSGRYAHKECVYNSNEAKKDRDQLLAYIQDLFGEKINFGIVVKQIKNYIDNYGYSYSGIHGTLYYCYKIKKQEINKAEGIGIVPFYYNEARKYWLQVNNAKEQNYSLVNQKKTIIINSPKAKVILKSKPLTLEELEEEINE